MIVYDHLGTPKPGDRRLTKVEEIGPDGSYDALYFYKKGGYFEWYRNVELADKYLSKLHRKQQAEIRKNQQAIVDRREASASEDPSVRQMAGLEKGRKSRGGRNWGSRKEQRKMLKELQEKQQKEAERVQEHVRGL